VQGYAADRTIHMYGYGYDLKTGKYLYTEVHQQNVHDGRWVSGTIDYYAADGTQIGHKDLDFSSDPFIPVYRLEQKQLGYIEGISAVTKSDVEMYKKADANSKMQTGSIKHIGIMAADSGFHSLIRAHFAELMAGKTIEFKLAVAGELDSFKFRIRRLKDEPWQGKPAVHLRVEMDSLLRWVVDPLDLLYDADTRELLEYRGISNIHDPATGKAYVVRIDYYPTKPVDAPAQLPPLVPAKADPAAH
ncbi:MAG: hypothetical protein ACRETM_13440, partial [Stenotrophobium sp.]